MVEESEVRQKLSEVSRSVLDVFEFEEWLESESRDMYADSSQDAIDLVSDIERLFAEYYRKALTEKELFTALSSLAFGTSIRAAATSVRMEFVRWASTAQQSRLLESAATA